MATQQEIMALIKAHADDDHERFRSMVICIAANSAKTSPMFAKTLREVADRAPKTARQFIALDPQMAELLSISRPTVGLQEMVLDLETRARIDRFLLEQTSREKLVEHGLSPMRKLLFVGQAGTGKTMMASAIAHALSLPMLRVQLHGVISRYLGETAAKLAKVFDSIRTLRGVYLFDEFDALAAERAVDGGGQGGEMRRVVNSLLQFIEDDTSESVIVAATNHHDMLDRAMYRRFDQSITFPMPTPEVAERLVRSRLLWTADIDWSEVRHAANGVGHADLVSACHHVNKDAVIADRTRIATDEIVEAIRARRHTMVVYDG